jgi:hypothetical protein
MVMIASVLALVPYGFSSPEWIRERFQHGDAFFIKHFTFSCITLFPGFAARLSSESRVAGDREESRGKPEPAR